MGALLPHDDSVNDRNTSSKLLCGEALTRKLWLHHFPGGTFWNRGCMHRGHEAPYFMGFDQHNSSYVTHGQVHIPRITLKDIPALRSHLKLKLSYGSTKVVTLDADLRHKGANSSPCMVNFSFDRNQPKDMTVQMKLYDQSLWRKKGKVRMFGKRSLEEFLTLLKSPIKHNSAHVIVLEGKKAEKHQSSDRQISKILLMTNLVPMHVLHLTVNDFYHEDLQADKQLLELCHGASLNKCQLTSMTKCWVAHHK